MTACLTTLGNSGTLVCTRTDDHQPHHGCVFVASSLTDAHDRDDSAARSGDER